jgi:polysaccharide biosynthesis transport protein
MSAELVPSTVTSYAAERIQIIAKRILTTENLLPIEEKFDLYPKQRKAGDIGDIVTRMRESVTIEMVEAEVLDPKRGQPSRSTIAFELSYDAESPQKAQNVANELVSLFLSENIKLRTEKAAGATEFLSEEANRLSEQISVLEAQLAAFKVKHTGRLPELINMNLGFLDRTQREMETVEQQISTLEQRRLELQSQLVQVEPNSGTSPAGRLRELQAQYVSASAIYSPEHPDVSKLTREIQALERELGIADSRTAVEGDLRSLRAQLAAAQQTYAAEHPDVVRLKTSIAALEQKLSRPSTSAKGPTLRPDNPAYIAIKTQLDTIEISLRSEIERRERLREKLGEYESRVVQTPLVEQEKLAIQREYDQAVKKFNEMKGKEMLAGVGEQLEKESKGERFSLVEPPDLPRLPIKPNRIGIFLLGFVLSFGTGVGYAGVVEFLDRSVRGSRGVVAVLGAPPLAVIPPIGSDDLHARA